MIGKKYENRKHLIICLKKTIIFKYKQNKELGYKESTTFKWITNDAHERLFRRREGQHFTCEKKRTLKWMLQKYPEDARLIGMTYTLFEATLNSISCTKNRPMKNEQVNVK